MNRESNNGGRGKAPKKGGPDLGRKTFIQQIIEKVESETSSRAALRPRARRVKSEGQSVDQPVLSTTFGGDTT